ncbi:mersacidin/lichenicidin family type 2 lantibiotic [Streptomyces sp. Rer75]|uniref:mersacidin/lichenicidin family type 2 lantibiotic n=1 Tax=Streptomyces TaxID=1883 RepID=UPI0015CFD567|nr:mersacidin/lichenicidin family type 2 lantibiotic [Streptomyces sp. Rer75]QLH25632.1 mersacidin/lichenicidin family type 2 lantibiotic [Streptomyces sp. Rer75]
MNSTVTAWKDTTYRQGLAVEPGHPAGTVDLTADLPDDSAIGAAETLSTQPFFDCCG